MPLVAGDFPQPGLDQLREPGGRSQPPLQSPDPEVVPQRPVVDGPEDEFAQEQGVPLTVDHEPVGRRPVDGPSEHLVQQLPDRFDGQAGDLDPLDIVGPPEGDDGIGCGLGGGDGGDDERRPVHRHLVDEGGRGVVEPVGVVDEQHQGAAGGHLDQRRRAAPEEIRAVDRRVRPVLVIGREHRGQGPQRQTGRRLRGGDAHDRRALGLEEGEVLRRQARLAHAGGTCDHHAAAPAALDPLHPPQLAGPPDERPLGPHPASIAHLRLPGARLPAE